MKNLLKNLTIVMAAFVSASTIAQSSEGSSRDSIFNVLASSENPEDQALLKQKLYNLLNSDQEIDWQTASSYFYKIGSGKISDSIVEAGKIKFPKGEWARRDAAGAIYEEENPVEKEKLYWDWVANFPPPPLKEGQEQMDYDYVRAAVSSAYAEAGNVKKAVEFSNMVETQYWKGEGWAGTGMILIKKGFVKEGGELLKMAWEIAYRAATAKSPSNIQKFAASGLSGYTAEIVRLLLDQKEYAHAKDYLKPVFNNVQEEVDGKLSDQYSQVLLAEGNISQAFEILGTSLMNGWASAEMKERYKELWPKVKGSAAGYEEYLVKVEEVLKAKLLEKLESEMINVPAPEFTLKDLDGNTVSLADYKDKIVVLDFWATWCGPCKASFPDMKRAVEYYEEDEDVKFLFIHTWENDDNPVESAKAFMAETEYPFQVLMDVKNEDGNNPVVTAYKAQGIPAKYFIDKNGNIRFHLTGLTQDFDPIEELTTIIEMCKQSS